MNKENFYEWVNKSDYVSDDVKDYYQKENKLYQNLGEVNERKNDNSKNSRKKFGMD
tara:strand:+ start:8099 stop:8266 length:168 start_codon:yes stop_codon:yes gene_type:complete